MDDVPIRTKESREPATLPAWQHHWRMALPQTGACWLVAGVFVLGIFATAAPSPLYHVYQEQLRFSALTLTVIFAVNSVAVLITLLLLGSMSDYVGRRPVIVAALVVNMGGCALYLAAPSVSLLIAARVLQGIAIGIGNGALGAAMIDLQPAGTTLASVANTAGNSLGQGMGALCTSLLAQYGPAPTRLIWWLMLGFLAVAAAVILVLPESVTRRPGVLTSLRPQVGVPAQARAMFAMAAPCLIATFGLCGFYLSLGPSLAVQVTGSPNLVWGGLVIFLLTGVAAMATAASASITARRAMLAGCLILFAGMAVTLGSIVTGTVVTFLASTAVAGVGYGLTFLGAFRSVSVLAPPSERARLVSAIWIVNFLALAVPAVIAGWAVTRYGLHRTALVYCAVIAALAATAASTLIVHSHMRRTLTTARTALSGHRRCAGSHH